MMSSRPPRRAEIVLGDVPNLDRTRAEAVQEVLQQRVRATPQRRRAQAPRLSRATHG